MSDPNDQAKAAKKRSKAEAKMAKKQAKAQRQAPAKTHTAQPAEAGSLAAPTPGSLAAARSVAAAEQQVRLQRWRVLIALLTMIVALLTFLFTARPWEWKDSGPQDTGARQRTQNGEDG